MNFSLQYYSGADTSAIDNSGMNPFMLAVEKNNLEVVKAMMEENPHLVSSPVGSGSTMTHWALKQAHRRSDFFKVCFDFTYLATLQNLRPKIQFYLDHFVTQLMEKNFHFSVNNL